MKRLGQPLIDLSSSLSFTMDGQTFHAYKGDTLASALLANGVKLMGRSFKYHRPRGVFSDGIEEPNALFTIGRGQDQSPNIRATEQEVFEGLEAVSQNRYPSLQHDLLSVNNLLSPFFGAGFYYKTFMWPKSFWERLYEPLIRRAAGLGALSGEEDRADYLRGFLFCDVLVIGSGLSGIWAAWLAGKAGADVLWLEGDFELGGRLIKDRGKVGNQAYTDWRKDMIEQIRKLPNVRIMTRTHVTGVYDGGIYGALERIADHKEIVENHGPRQCFWRIHAREAVNAGGATERPIAFENNDLPGIMLAGSVRAYFNRFGVTAGRKIAIFTDNDDGWKTAFDLESLGTKPVALIDSRAHGKVQLRIDPKLALDFPIYTGVRVLKARGGKALKEILLSNGLKIDCDVLAVSGGWNPNVHLHCHHNGRPIWNDEIGAFVPREHMIKGLTAVGAANGFFSDEAILEDVESKLAGILKALGLTLSKQKRPDVENVPYNIEPLFYVGSADQSKHAWIDFQNDVTIKDIRQAHLENFQSVEHMKRYTTLGMATDQGKTANIMALAIMAELSGQSIPDMGTTTFRPPYTPIPIAALGAGAVGKSFAPERLMPSHGFNLERGAPMIEAGLWYRPSYYPLEGEANWRQSCDREVRFVREAVGVSDVSTLGKIRIMGKDAARFLDLVYSNKMSTLVSGRIRYGLMLREDGMVMDDGTCACLGENDYLITTTTAAAGEVMLHLEFVQQCLVPDYDVELISVTDQFAQFAVAGPRARELLSALVDIDISAENLPFMASASCQIGGVEARLYRISFSGELGYEIALPRRYGDHLFRELVLRAEAFGGGVYGLEALNVLRIEKGFITHAEIHGRVTAFDIGLEKMISTSKDCIGKTMALREGLKGSHRPLFVGLKPVGAVKRLLAGSLAFESGADPVRSNVKGYLTSACYSPTFGSMIGLGFIENGRNRMGEKIRLVDHVREFETICEITSPIFYDPKGEKLHG